MADWGVDGHDHLGQIWDRRDRGLANVIRFANEYSVPGPAGLSFLRSIVWALTGVDFAAASAAEGRPLSARLTAEGAEALGCWSAIAGYLKHDMRMTGAQKLPLVDAKDVTMKRLRGGRGYVSQPIRVGVVAALPPLGLVEASNSRFNNSNLSERGKEFRTPLYSRNGFFGSGHDLEVKWRRADCPQTGDPFPLTIGKILKNAIS